MKDDKEKRREKWEKKKSNKGRYNNPRKKNKGSSEVDEE